MAATASRPGERARPGWVEFSDEPERTGDPAATRTANLTQPVTDSSAWMAAPTVASEQRSSWVQFDEKPWSPSPPPTQVKGPRNSICSSASFWSAVPVSESTHSEDLSSVSVGASSCDLNTEDMPSRNTSRPHSPNSSVCQEDEVMNMDTLNWTPTTPHTNGQSSRFSSWVTFDDDEVPNYQHVTKPANIKVDNLNNSPLQDANSNLILSPIRNQRTDRHILDLTPDGTSSDSVFELNSPLLSNSSPYSKKNPFLDEFSHVQPSPINPFSAYFKTELKSSGSSDSENAPAFSFSSPIFEPTTDVKRDSGLPNSPTSNAAGGYEFHPSVLSGDGLDQLRNIKISDPDQAGPESLPDDSVDEEEEEETLYQPAFMAPRDGWPMLLRIPEKKNIMSSRHWGLIFVRLSDDNQIQLFYEKGLEKPFKVFQLNAQLELSEHKMQIYEENGRVHTLSLNLVTYKEKRKIQPKVTVMHIPVKEQLVKLGTVDYQDFLSFRHALQEKLVGLSSDVDTLSSPLSFSEEEIQVEVMDNFYGVLSKGENHILQQHVTTRVSVLAFLSGSVPCHIGLNDIQVKGKEVVSRHDIVPNTTTRWIRLRNCQLHDCADQSEFSESRTIAFEPPLARRFELMRFRTVYAEKTLPFTLKTVVSIRGAEVELQSWLVMSTGFSPNRGALMLIPCENVAIRYPLPDIWAKNFRRESVTGEKSLKARFNKGASFGSATSSGSEPAMRVTLGTVKYEQAFRSVVWRISRLPDKNSVLGHPHTFFCRLELGSDWEVPRQFQCHVEVEFDMPATSASKATVRSLSVGDKTEVKKWITYKAHYSYQVAIEQKNEREMTSQQQESPGECVQQ